MKKFDKNAPTPKFKEDWDGRLSQYGEGLTIIRTDQCPYSVKNVREISETAETTYGIKPDIIDLIYDGKAIAHHPISKTRFTNIMNKILR